MPESEISLEKITETYYKKIFKLCLFYLDNKEESEEITQGIFLKILEKLPSFKGYSDIYTWIYRIALNTVINFQRRKKIIQFISLENISDNKLNAQETSNADPAISMETSQVNTLQINQLKKAVNSLSAREKTALYLFHYENLKQREIANLMKTSVSAVESLIYKAKRKIKKKIKGSTRQF